MPTEETPLCAIGEKLELDLFEEELKLPGLAESPPAGVSSPMKKILGSCSTSKLVVSILDLPRDEIERLWDSNLRGSQATPEKLWKIKVRSHVVRIRGRSFRLKHAVPVT